MLQWKDAFKKNAIAFGGASLSGEGGGYGFGDLSENQAIDLVKIAFDKGLRVFDTAPIYGFGTSEVRLGKAIKEIREEVFIITKCGVDWDQKKNVAIRNDPATTKRMLDESLKRLDCDVIDLYMVHWPSEEVDIRKTLEVIAKAQDQGKVRSIGLCNTNDSELDLAFEVTNIDVVQNQFNLFVRDAQKMFARFKQQGIGFMSWGTLDKGIIPGTVNRKRQFDQSDVRASETPWWNDDINGPKIDFMTEIQGLLEQQEVTGLELALGHNLSEFRKSDIHGVVLCVAKTEIQLDSLFLALKKNLSEDLLLEIKQRLARKGM